MEVVMGLIKKHELNEVIGVGQGSAFGSGSTGGL